MKYPVHIEKLIRQLTKLPSVGPKTAERYVFSLLNMSNSDLKDFAESVLVLKEKTIICRECFAVSDRTPCAICSDSTRNKETICIVANTREMLAIDASKEYRGYYQVLGGLINAIEEIGPEKLKINELVERIKRNQAQEVIIGLNPNIEGETTAMYLFKLLKEKFPNLKISRLARGLPMGADIEYADELTIANALKYRNIL